MKSPETNRKIGNTHTKNIRTNHHAMNPTNPKNRIPTNNHPLQKIHINKYRYITHFTPHNRKSE